jgi:hypothetical protein
MVAYGGMTFLVLLKGMYKAELGNKEERGERAPSCACIRRPEQRSRRRTWPGAVGKPSSSAAHGTAHHPDLAPTRNTYGKGYVKRCSILCDTVLRDAVDILCATFHMLCDAVERDAQHVLIAEGGVEARDHGVVHAGLEVALVEDLHLLLRLHHLTGGGRGQH